MEGGQRVGIGTVSAWAGSQMAWEAAPGVPCTSGESGVVPWASQVAFVASVSSPEKMGAVSLPPCWKDRGPPQRVVARCLSWDPRAGAGPHRTQPVTSHGPAFCATAGCTPRAVPGLLPDSSLSSSSPPPLLGRKKTQRCLGQKPSQVVQQPLGQPAQRPHRTPPPWGPPSSGWNPNLQLNESLGFQGTPV